MQIEYLDIPLQQHLGEPAQPIVQPGVEVEKGQLIAVPHGLGSRIHASMRGRIITVSSDKIGLVPSPKQPDQPILIPVGRDLAETVEFAGVVGAGGAGFPTAEKIRALRSGMTIIANAVECEPLFFHNQCQITLDSGAVIRGLKYVADSAGAVRVLMAIKKNRELEKQVLQSALKGTDIEIVELPDIYPAGDERVILREVLGIYLQPGQIPLEVGAAVFNVETLSNICQAVEKRYPVIAKDLTIAGKIQHKAREVVIQGVPVGATVAAVLKAIGGIADPYGEIRLGGPFSSNRGGIDSAVTKRTGGIMIGEPLASEKRLLGLIGCECGASLDRLQEIAQEMKASVAGAVNCSQMLEKDGRWRCTRPGLCPGQETSIKKLIQDGAEVLLIGCCSECTHSAVTLASKLSLDLYHSTDQIMTAAGKPLLRLLPEPKG